MKIKNCTQIAGESSSDDAEAGSEQAVGQESENSVGQLPPSTSGFTVSSRSAFQPSQPRPSGSLPRRLASLDNRNQSSQRTTDPAISAAVNNTWSLVMRALARLASEELSQEAGTSSQSLEALATQVAQTLENERTAAHGRSMNEENDEQVDEQNSQNLVNRSISQTIAGRIVQDEEELARCLEPRTDVRRSIQSLSRQLDMLRDSIINYNETEYNSAGGNNRTNTILNNHNNNSNDRNNRDEESGEQSGYWLLEENSNSDSIEEIANTEPGTSSSTNSRNWTSRWISLESNYPDRQPTNETSTTGTEQESSNVQENLTGRDSLSDRNRLSPVIVNSTRYEQPPLFPFSSLRENQAKKREEENRKKSKTAGDQRESRAPETTAATSFSSSLSLPSTSAENSHGNTSHEDCRLSQPSSSRASTSSHTANPHVNLIAGEESHSCPCITCGAAQDRSARILPTTSDQSILGNVDEPEDAASRETDGNNPRSDETGFRGWTSRRPTIFNCQNSSFYRSWVYRITRARLEIVRLRRGALMWEQFYNEVCSLDVGSNANEENGPSTSAASTESNSNAAVPSIRLANSTMESSDGSGVEPPAITSNAEAERIASEIQQKIRNLRMKIERHCSQKENQPSTSAAGSSHSSNDIPSTSAATSTPPDPEQLEKLSSEVQTLLAATIRYAKYYNVRGDLSNDEQSKASNLDIDQPSTSNNSNSPNQDSTKKPVTNYKKILLANYKRENSETDGESLIGAPDTESSTEPDNTKPNPAKRMKIETNDEATRETRAPENCNSDSLLQDFLSLRLQICDHMLTSIDHIRSNNATGSNNSDTILLLASMMDFNSKVSSRTQNDNSSTNLLDLLISSGTSASLVENSSFPANGAGSSKIPRLSLANEGTASCSHDDTSQPLNSSDPPNPTEYLPRRRVGNKRRVPV